MADNRWWRAQSVACLSAGIHHYFHPSALCALLNHSEHRMTRSGGWSPARAHFRAGPGSSQNPLSKEAAWKPSRSASAARHRSAVFLNEEGQHVRTALWSTNFNCKYVKIHTFQWKRIRHQSVNEGNQWNTVKNDNGDKKVYKKNTFFANIW